MSRAGFHYPSCGVTSPYHCCSSSPIHFPNTNSPYILHRAGREINRKHLCPPRPPSQFLTLAAFPSCIHCAPPPNATLLACSKEAPWPTRSCSPPAPAPAPPQSPRWKCMRGGAGQVVRGEGQNDRESNPVMRGRRTRAGRFQCGASQSHRQRSRVRDTQRKRIDLRSRGSNQIA